MYWLVGIAAAYAAVVILVAVRRIWKKQVEKQVKKFDWMDRMQGGRWDYQQSWPSTLTAITAVFGSISAFSSALLPEETQIFSKGQYIGLHVFFVLLAIMAMIVYNGTRTHNSLGKKLDGYAWAFVLASAISLWAATGQSATWVLLIREMEVQSSMAPLVAQILHVSLFLTVLPLMPIYAFNAMYHAVVTQEIAPDQMAASDVPSWPML